jgi:heme/copper-type cytochrome/quinol oxidase subunit 2
MSVCIPDLTVTFEFFSCFLSQFGALIGAFLVPIFVIIAINVVFFVWVIVVVSRHTKEKADRTKQTITNKQILRITFSLSGVLFLFGLTWGFFILTFSVSGLRETFQILFTVFNSLQGFFVFIFILFTEGFGYWKAFLSCDKYRSPKPASHPSALGTNSVPAKNQQIYAYTDPSNLSKQGQGRNYYSKGYSNVLNTAEIDADRVRAKERVAFYY